MHALEDGHEGLILLHVRANADRDLGVSVAMTTKWFQSI